MAVSRALSQRNRGDIELSIYVLPPAVASVLVNQRDKAMTWAADLSLQQLYWEASSKIMPS